MDIQMAENCDWPKHGSSCIAQSLLFFSAQTTDSLLVSNMTTTALMFSLLAGASRKDLSLAPFYLLFIQWKCDWCWFSDLCWWHCYLLFCVMFNWSLSLILYFNVLLFCLYSCFICLYIENSAVGCFLPCIPLKIYINWTFLVKKAKQNKLLLPLGWIFNDHFAANTTYVSH